MFNSSSTSSLTKNEKETAESITNYIIALSKELNVEGTKGVIGNELELIALVRNCEFLYNRNLSGFKNPIKKDAAWKAIASVMHAAVFEVQHRWRTLRESYNRYKKEIESGENNGKVWEFYEDMAFIEPHIVPRRSSLIKSDRSEDMRLDGESDSSMERAGDLLYFIGLIKERTNLYDTKHIDFKSMRMREQTWFEIARIVGISVSDCQMRWKNLRERYGRERRNQDTSKRPWELFNALSFLDPYVKTRSSRYRNSSRNVQILAVNPVANDTGDSTIILQEENPLETIGATVENTDDIPNLEFVDLSTASSVVSEGCKADGRGSKGKYCLDGQDEDELFGLSIAAELRKIPSSKKKMKIKADMYKLLYDNESD